jgi:hypothetical protein
VQQSRTAFDKGGLVSPLFSNAKQPRGHKNIKPHLSIFDLGPTPFYICIYIYIYIYICTCIYIYMYILGRGEFPAVASAVSVSSISEKDVPGRSRAARPVPGMSPRRIKQEFITNLGSAPWDAPRCGHESSPRTVEPVMTEVGPSPGNPKGGSQTAENQK